MLKDQADQLRTRMQARVPIKGSLSFLDSRGTPHAMGIDVGHEQSMREPRSHIEGATPSTAIWSFGVVPDPFTPPGRQPVLLNRRIPVDRLPQARHDRVAARPRLRADRPDRNRQAIEGAAQPGRIQGRRGSTRPSRAIRPSSTGPRPITTASARQADGPEGRGGPGRRGRRQRRSRAAAERARQTRRRRRSPSR